MGLYWDNGKQNGNYYYLGFKRLYQWDVGCSHLGMNSTATDYYKGE